MKTTKSMAEYYDLNILIINYIFNLTNYCRFKYCEVMHLKFHANNNNYN